MDKPKKKLIVPTKPHLPKVEKISRVQDLMEDALIVLREEISTFKTKATKPNHSISHAEARVFNAHVKSLLDLEKALLEREKWDKFGSLTDEELLEELNKYQKMKSDDK